jgi:membrane protein required for colicin V production
MNAFDIVLLAIVGLSCLSGLRTGLTRVVVHLVSMLVALLAAFWCYGIVAAKLTPWISRPFIAQIAGFCVIFFGISILGSLLGALLARLFEGIGLGWLDHLLGGAAGLVRGAVLVAITITMIMAFTPLPAPAFLSESKVVPYATAVSGAITEFAPKPLRDGFLQQMEKLKQLWMKTPSKVERIA